MPPTNSEKSPTVIVPFAARRRTDSVASAISSAEPSVAARPQALRRASRLTNCARNFLVVVLPALEQIALEPEQADFLDEAVRREDRPEIVLMPRVGRAAPHHAVSFRAEAARHEHAGNAGEQHQRQHLPSEPRHQTADRRQRDDRLADADHLKHHAERARADFVVRVAQRVVGLGVLEALDVERRGLVQNPQADAILQRVAQQLARRAVDGLDERRADGDADLQREQRRERAIRLGRVLKLAGDRAGDFVDEQLANPQCRGRHERQHDAENENQREEAGACRPDEMRRRRQVGQHLPRAHPQRNRWFRLGGRCGGWSRGGISPHTVR